MLRNYDCAKVYYCIILHAYLAGAFEDFKELFPEPGEAITFDLMWSASLLVLTPVKVLITILQS